MNFKKTTFLKKILLFLVFFLSVFVVNAQKISELVGVVRDSVTNEAIIGASVTVKGTKIGVVTDSEGQFLLKVPSSAKEISVKMIGYSLKQVLLAGQQKIEIVLSPDQALLNEVVVTALGIKQEKKALGYATQQVKLAGLEQAKTLNIGNALTGQVAGLTVNNPTGMFQKPSFSMRGKEPIIVVDGIVVETDFFDIADNNIANINVLKGTAASALYGSRGRNGAILITTKNPQKEGLEVSVTTSNMMTAGFTVFPEVQTQYGNGSNGKYEFWDGQDGGISDGDMIWGPKFGTGIKVAQWNSPIRDKQTGEVISWWGDVAGTKYDDRSRYERVPTDWVRHNNLKDFLRTGIVTNNDVTIAYKGEKAQVLFSGKYAHQRGQVPNTSLNNGAFNLNTTFQLRKNITLDANMSYNTLQSPNYPRYGYGPPNHMYTVLIWMGDDVNVQDLKNHQYVPGFDGYRQANYNYAWYNNVYFAANHFVQQYRRNVLNGFGRLRWELAPGFSIQGRANVRNNGINEDQQIPKSYFNYSDARNGNYRTFQTQQTNIDLDVLAEYHKKVSDRFLLTVNAGASSLNRVLREATTSTDGLVDPFTYNLANSQGRVSATNNYLPKTVRSIYATANAELYNAFYLNVTGRNDWSSAIPNHSYFYPSASLSTMLSNLIKMPKAIDYLKLYTSWAQVSSDLDPYSLRATYGRGLAYGSLPSVTYPSSLVNSGILPETSTSFEYGLSTSLAKKLDMEFTYYTVFDKNQIIDFPASEASGFESRKVNGNRYRTHGLEVMLNLKAIQKKDFSWNVGVNWSRSVRRLVEIYGNEAKFGNLFLGDRADSYYGTVWQKSADGQLILSESKDEDGNVQVLPVKDPNKQNLGHLEPNWRLGLQNRFKIKGVDIAIDIDGAWGGILNSITVEKMWWGGKHPSSVLYRDEEYAAGKPVYVPQGVIVTSGNVKYDINGKIIEDTRTYKTNTNPISWQTWAQNYPYRANVTEKESKLFANTFDRSFFKMRRISVGYDFAKFFKAKQLKGLYVSAYSYNPLIWKKMPLLDPDYGNDDNLQDPSARYVGLSVNFKF